MSYITKEKIKEIIDNAPEGTSPAGIVAALRKKGHTFEGYELPEIKEIAIPKPVIPRIAPIPEGAPEPIKRVHEGMEQFLDVRERMRGEFFTVEARLGERGPLGFLKLIPKIEEMATRTIPAQMQTAEERGRIATETTNLIKEMRALPEGTKKDELANIIKENFRIMGVKREEEAALEEMMMDPSEAAEITLNTMITAVLLVGGISLTKALGGKSWPIIKSAMTKVPLSKIRGLIPRKMSPIEILYLGEKIAGFFF